MYTVKDYKALLKMFFEKRGQEADIKMLARLDDFSDEKIMTLYEMIFTEDEAERQKKIEAFRSNIAQKHRKESQELETLIQKMDNNLHILEELGEKTAADKMLDTNF
ncbi:MAG: hypothetical protein LBU27_02070 [Candidatus Peribacteria bacterium]|jgi:hypothetical protein|nr:hypothetical protein [Candidatus Peribacteria bacterium]